MSGNLDDVERMEGVDNDTEIMGDAPAGRTRPESLADKQQAQMSMESRRRLEEKLEETRVKKQIQDYDFDDEWG